VTLKSGTNNFHGTASISGDYDWLNARNSSPPPPSPITITIMEHGRWTDQEGPHLLLLHVEGQRNTALEPYNLAIPRKAILAAALRISPIPLSTQVVSLEYGWIESPEVLSVFRWRRWIRLLHTRCG